MHRLLPGMPAVSTEWLACTAIAKAQTGIPRICNASTAMQYAHLGNSGLIVSKMALGALTFGSGRGRAAGKALYKVDQSAADRLVAKALESGINHFNTADVYSYGESEEILGRALGSERKKVVISTKVGHRMSPALNDAGLSRGHIIRAAEQSLRRLATDYIDVYLAHLTDPFTPLDETLEAFDYLVRQGMVRHIGFSNWPAWLAATAVGLQQLHGWAQFRVAEMYYSVLGRDLEIEVLPFARMAGIGIFVWSPLAGGFLSGKYTRDDPTGGGGRLAGFDRIPFDRESGYALVDLLKAIAAKHQQSPAGIALAWLLAQPQISSVLIGASSPEQLTQNLQANDIRLSEQDLDRLNQAVQPRKPSPHWIMEFSGDDVRQQALAQSATNFGIPPDREHRRWGA